MTDHGDHRFDQLHNRMMNHRPTDDGIIRIEAMRRYALDWAKFIQLNVPLMREQSIAMEKVEEALFWANAGIARDRGLQEKPGA